MVYKSFAELEDKHWMTNQYHRVSTNWFITDGVKDLIESFKCPQVVSGIITNEDIEKGTYGNFPRIEVKAVGGMKVVEFYIGKVNEDGDDDITEKPFKVITNIPILPLGTLRFEVGLGDAEGKTHILALMSEH